jgi:catechol 2,3-dioxygenase-like lactoylglutathione lyase family enzyme
VVEDNAADHGPMLTGRAVASQLVKVTGFDHLVLAVGDVDRSLAWYTGVLGLAPVRVDEWRRGEAPFPSVRVDAATIIDLIPRSGDGEGRNLDHFCLVVEPTDLAGWATLSAITVVDGPGPRFGAQGVATSIYIDDPDGYMVELRHYG